MNTTQNSPRFFVSTFESLDDVAWRPSRGDGTQIGVELNTAHPFYKGYLQLNNNDRARHSLDLLMLNFAKAELEGDAKARTFYESERKVWSKFLNDSLTFMEGLTSSQEGEQQDV